MSITRKKYPCPACGFLVFDEPPGSFDICSVCAWEDDDVQLSFPGYRGGANGTSLYEWQLRAQKKYPLNIRTVNRIERDARWRPLRTDELGDKNQAPTSPLEYFHALSESDVEYYWLKGN